MTGTREFLINIKPYKNCFVTFGDGAKAYIIGKGQLVHPGAQCLTEALLVEGLKPNLISIGQLCNLELNVNFTKTKCLVLDQKQGEVVQGKRSFDNCYLWTPYQIKASPKCLLSRAKTTKLWHRKLGHLNLRSMQKAISENAISWYS